MGRCRACGCTGVEPHDEVAKGDRARWLRQIDEEALKDAPPESSDPRFAREVAVGRFLKTPRGRALLHHYRNSG